MASATENSSTSPRETGYLQVSEKHEIFYALYGNKAGIPVVVLHGGPGAGTNDGICRFFDLDQYNVVMFDQRGAMRSKPFACMEENTTWDLVEDIEKLREHLGINQWMVFGGSWGALLGVLYGEEHPEACTGFILRGVFLGRAEDINLFDRENRSPEAKEEFASIFQEEERKDLLEATYKHVMDPDPSVHLPVARAFLRFHFIATGIDLSLIPSDRFTLSLVRAIMHYSVHQLFLEPNQVLSKLPAISSIPSIIVQGVDDKNCLPEQALLLHQNWSNSRLWQIEGAGHSADDPLITEALIRATQFFLEERENI